MVDSLPMTLPEDPKEAQKVFNSLPIKNQLDIVLKARGKERLHYLFLSEHSEELVQQLPELEVFLTVKEIGERDSLELISLTTPEQFLYLLGLDFWKRDQLDPEKILNWMEILLESGEKKVTQFIQSTDPEFIEVIIDFLGKGLNVSPRYLKELDLSGCYPEEWWEITLSTIFFTSLANQILRGTFQFEAIKQGQVKDFLYRVFESDAQGKGVIKMEVRNGLRDWYYSIEGEEIKRQHLLAFQDFCLDLVEEEYGKIPPEEKVAPRFVKGLLIRK